MYDPQSNGAVEKAVDQVMGQLRTLKLSLESRLGSPVNNNWPIINWLVEHTCTTMNRGQIGHGGKIPYRRLMGKEAAQPLAEVGEQILAKPYRPGRAVWFIFTLGVRKTNL